LRMLAPLPYPRLWGRIIISISYNIKEVSKLLNCPSIDDCIVEYCGEKYIRSTFVCFYFRAPLIVAAAASALLPFIEFSQARTLSTSS
jgi:hypothetical protein